MVIMILSSRYDDSWGIKGGSVTGMCIYTLGYGIVISS